MKHLTWALLLLLPACGDDGGSSTGTDTTTTSTGSTSSGSTGVATGSSTGSSSSSTGLPDPGTTSTGEAGEETGNPINCGDTICGPGLICVEEITEVGGGTGTGTGGGGRTQTDWLCRSRPPACEAGMPADCACAAVVCSPASCLCSDLGTNRIECSPDASCG